MTYKQAFDKLFSSHFYPTFISEVSGRKVVVVGLEVKSIDFVQEYKINRLKEFLGEGFSMEFLEDKGVIQIKKA